MFSYKKPRNYMEAHEEFYKIPLEDCYINFEEKRFQDFAPILFMYKKNKLKYIAYYKMGVELVVLNFKNDNIVKKLSKDIRSEIDMNIKQLELF